MNAYDIIDGIEAELELERELGVRVVEIDRALLQDHDPRPVIRDSRADIKTPVANLAPRATNHESPTPGREPRPANIAFAFLHDRPLSQGGIEMMGKIITAMKQTPETAPIIFAGDRPDAKVCVVLGSAALKKWFPTLRGAPGQWLRGPGGEDVLITYSPEYILRMGPVTPAVREIKVKMWTSLKGVMQRVVSR